MFSSDSTTYLIFDLKVVTLKGEGHFYLISYSKLSTQSINEFKFFFHGVYEIHVFVMLSNILATVVALLYLFSLYMGSINIDKIMKKDK